MPCLSHARALGIAALAACLWTPLSAALAEGTLPTLSVEAERAPAPPGTFRRVVAHGDLDLATAAGRQALRDRLWAAARDGCADLYRDDPAVVAFPGRRDCTRASLRRAAPQVDAVTRLAAAGGNVGTQVALVGTR